jgi:acetyl esterase/lipase
MKKLIFVLCFVFLCCGADAQTPVWQPSPGHTQIPIWPGTPPDARHIAAPEDVKVIEKDKFIAGKPWAYVENVTRPTMTVYSPQGKNTGVAVIVFPGGGYNILAIDLEGSEVCDWLTTKGITCVVLKYRVPCAVVGPHRDCPTALQDAQRALGLMRFHAAEWNIDPHKIGVLGFSAGGHMIASISTHFQKRLYPAVDAADKESCRPDFAIGLYPGHLAAAETNFSFNSGIHVTSQTPPTFLVQATDDPVDDVRNSWAYYLQLKRAGVSVEMHLFAHGGHAFGLRRTENPITEWPQLAEKWLATIGMIPR